MFLYFSGIFWGGTKFDFEIKENFNKFYFFSKFDHRKKNRLKFFSTKIITKKWIIGHFFLINTEEITTNSKNFTCEKKEAKWQV